MGIRSHIRLFAAAGILPVAVLLFASCKEDVVCQEIDKELVPVQVVYDMSVISSENSSISMRMSAPVMQRFSFVKDSILQSYEFYPDHFNVDVFTPEGMLETNIHSDQARHVTTPGRESWSAFGHVVVTNFIKGQCMTSDTVYWNREEKKIYTDCYVRLDSPQGVMQGYGMESDERATNALILNPFDSYTPLNDSTNVFVDTVNVMGPFQRNAVPQSSAGASSKQKVQETPSAGASSEQKVQKTPSSPVTEAKR